MREQKELKVEITEYSDYCAWEWVYVDGEWQVIESDLLK